MSGSCRCVKNERGIQPNVTHLRQAFECPALRDDAGDFRFSDQAKTMRTRRNKQRRILTINGIDMNPRGQHRSEKRCRRRHVADALLHRPRAVSIHFPPLLHGDRAILMPSEAPVAIRTLVKERCAHRSRICTEIIFNKRFRFSHRAEIVKRQRRNPFSGLPLIEAIE